MTKREQQVLDLLMEFPGGCRTFTTNNGIGKGEKTHSNTNRIIGAKLGMAERTVKRYIALIGQKWDIDPHRFLVRQRIVYLESVRRGLIPILDKAEAVQ